MSKTICKYDKCKPSLFALGIKRCVDYPECQIPDIEKSINNLIDLVENLNTKMEEFEKRLKTQEGHMEFVLTDEKGIYKDD